VALAQSMRIAALARPACELRAQRLGNVEFHKYPAPEVLQVLGVQLPRAARREWAAQVTRAARRARAAQVTRVAHGHRAAHPQVAFQQRPECLPRVAYPQREARLHLSVLNTARFAPSARTAAMQSLVQLAPATIPSTD